jgi:hypothetical protein
MVADATFRRIALKVSTAAGSPSGWIAAAHGLIATAKGGLVVHIRSRRRARLSGEGGAASARIGCGIASLPP